MSNLIRIGMPINGRTRRFGRLGKSGFVYSCPNCVGLVSNNQGYCVCGENLSPVAMVCSGRPEDDLNIDPAGWNSGV